MLYSCNKDSKPLPASNSQTNSVSDTLLLPGKWSIIAEFYTFTLLPDGVPKTWENYVGCPSDYYNILSNGTIFEKEGNKNDTFTYKLLSGNQILIGGLKGTIYNLTEHAVSLTLFEPTPGGPLYDSISLQR